MVNKSAMVAFASTASPVLLPSTSTFVTGLKCNSNKPCTQLVSITYRTRPTYRPLRMMTSPPPSSSSSTDSGMDDANNTMDTGTRVEETSTLIPGTPCFTRRILASPMTRTDRSIYLQAITKSVDAYLHSILPLPSTTATSKIGQLTLLVPQLNPSVDVYDRRFLLQTTWAVLASTVITHKLRTRVLIQGSRAFGAIPLSIAGLRKHFDADLELSAEDWPQTIRSGDLEDINDLDDDDDIIIIVSPTNAISLPVVESVTDCLKRAKGKPIILINPRLDDVPSHSGVMQVSGRSDRISFLQTIQHIFYLRLLYDPGSVRVFIYLLKLLNINVIFFKKLTFFLFLRPSLTH